MSICTSCAVHVRKSWVWVPHLQVTEWCIQHSWEKHQGPLEQQLQWVLWTQATKRRVNSEWWALEQHTATQDTWSGLEEGDYCGKKVTSWKLLVRSSPMSYTVCQQGRWRVQIPVAEAYLWWASYCWTIEKDLLIWPGKEECSNDNQQEMTEHHNYHEEEVSTKCELNWTESKCNCPHQVTMRHGVGHFGVIKKGTSCLIDCTVGWSSGKATLRR